MDSTLKSLGELLIQSIPTIIFFVFLAVYLKYVFFRPLQAILNERKKSTEGVRELARQAVDAADKKDADYAAALQSARFQVGQEHEAMRREWAERHAAALAAARAEVQREIQQTQARVAAEIAQARAELQSYVEQIGERIVDTLTRRRAA